MQAGKWLMAFGLGAALTAGFFLVAPQFRSRTPVAPPWHPFELRSDLTLDDLVADGYRVSDMPCGMIHFAKTLGDTTIRYYVDVDCVNWSNPREARQALNPEVVEEELVEIVPSSDTGSARVSEINWVEEWSKHSAENPYWPFDGDMVRGCHQEILWRHYWFTMDVIDSLAVRRFVAQHEGWMYNEQWDCEQGGVFMVGHASRLDFACRIHRNFDVDSNVLPWRFEITTSIPFLDHARRAASRDRMRLEEEAQRDYLR
ncbi:MAG: hypothetical protein IPK70_07685 [Flavobacteriales bacterium]|jgi:hypothetical protein|nr:hypothetical protein [Flavobacteriales bacterium]